MIVIFLGIVLAIAASVIGRFRRARGEEREQLKWLAYSAFFLVTLAVLGVLNTMVVGNRVIEFAVGQPFWCCCHSCLRRDSDPPLSPLRHRHHHQPHPRLRDAYGLLAAGYVATIMAFQGIGSLVTRFLSVPYSARSQHSQQ